MFSHVLRLISGNRRRGGVGKAETTNKSNPKTVKPARLYHAGHVACVYRLKLMRHHFSMKLKCTDGDVIDSGSSVRLGKHCTVL